VLAKHGLGLNQRAGDLDHDDGLKGNSGAASRDSEGILRQSWLFVQT
jgi:hypothetical protein